MDIENMLTGYMALAQGRVFGYVVRNHYDFKIFVESFFESDYCQKNLDEKFSIATSDFHDQLLDIVLQVSELKPAMDNDPISEEMACDIGYLYRRLARETKMLSIDVFHLFPITYIVELMNEMGDDFSYDAAIIHMLNTLN